MNLAADYAGLLKPTMMALVECTYSKLEMYGAKEEKPAEKRESKVKKFRPASPSDVQTNELWYALIAALFQKQYG